LREPPSTVQAPRAGTWRSLLERRVLLPMTVEFSGS
jgi:hypothetical protein